MASEDKYRGVSMNETAPDVEMIPIDQINVFESPKPQTSLVFQAIIANISTLGLKKPITVARRKEPTDGKTILSLSVVRDVLRLLLLSGQTEIPAIVKEASKTIVF